MPTSSSSARWSASPALAYFTVAATLANRVLGLTYRLSGVFFPAASALAAGGELARLDRLYLKATRYVVFLNAAMLVLVAVFAEPDPALLDEPRFRPPAARWCWP